LLHRASQEDLSLSLVQNKVENVVGSPYIKNRREVITMTMTNKELFEWIEHYNREREDEEYEALAIQDVKENERGIEEIEE